MPQVSVQTRLCPHCANSIGVDASICPYCKADLTDSFEPEWPRRDADEAEYSAVSAPKEKLTVKSKAILLLGLLVFALGVYMVGGNVERHDLGPALAEQKKALAEQQMALAEKDERIKSLESQLAEVRRNNQGSTQQIETFKAKLEQSQKDLAAAQKKLTAANQDIARLSSERAAPAPRAPARTADASAAPPPAPRPSPSAEPRTYQTVRSTAVHEEPVNSSRVVAQIGKGTQITVVGSGGGWLEVRSKHGKPPGFIRADDAMFVSRSANSSAQSPSYP
jgi:hypothetical protein